MLKAQSVWRFYRNLVRTRELFRMRLLCHLHTQPFDDPHDCSYPSGLALLDRSARC